MDGLSRAEKAVKANVHVDRIGEGASQNATGPCHHFIEDSRDDTPVNGMTESGMSNFRNPLSMDGFTIGFPRRATPAGFPCPQPKHALSVVTIPCRPSCQSVSSHSMPLGGIFFRGGLLFLKDPPGQCLAICPMTFPSPV